MALPDVPARMELLPSTTGDDGARIQLSMNQIAEQPVDASGYRGALLLKRGTWRLEGVLMVPSGVVLRGEGQDADGTRLIATGTIVRPLIHLGEPGVQDPEGKLDPSTEVASSVQAILDERVPVGAKRLQISQPARFKVGEEVEIKRPSTAAWIHAIGMDQIVPGHGDMETKQWTAGGYDLSFSRQVISVDDHSITIDAPMVMAIERSFGGGTVAAKLPRKIFSNTGVERLRLISDYRIGAETSDESHASVGIEIGPMRDGFVREVTARHFIQGCVVVMRGARRITIQDCAAIDAVSLIKGGRRYSFYINGGEQILVQRGYSRNGRHDFVTGSRVRGPSAFVDCLAELCHDDCGPHHRWAVGLLYDQITCKELNVRDRGSPGNGHGWAGANHVFWNCTASIICQQAPTAQNWAIGCVGSQGTPILDRPQGIWNSWGSPVTPRSLYLAQLLDRLGSEAVNAVTTPLQRTESITNWLRQRFASEAGYASLTIQEKQR